MKTNFKRALRAMFVSVDFSHTLPFRAIALFGAGSYLSMMAFTLKEPTLMELFWAAVRVCIHSTKTFIMEGFMAAIEEQEAFFKELGLI